MIVGVGNDIIDVRRIDKTLKKSHGETFKRRVFTDKEIKYCDRMANSAPHFAARWAIKEAFYKALPEDIQKLSHWLAIELVRDSSKKPVINVCDEALDKIFKELGIRIFHSVSHEKEYSSAVVILEKE